MEFTWDDRKNRANQQKHGIIFETAILVFDDPLNVSVQDREVDGDPRWQIIGMVNGVHVLLVAHTVDLDEDIEFASHPVRSKSDAPGAENLCARHL